WFDGTMTRSDSLVPSRRFPTHGYTRGLLGEISSPGTEGLSSFPHTPSLHVAADPPPVGAAVSDSSSTAPAAFARYRPSRPPDLRVTRLRLRSLTLQPGALRTSFRGFVGGLHRLVRPFPDWVMRPWRHAPMSQRRR